MRGSGTSVPLSLTDELRRDRIVSQALAIACFLVALYLLTFPLQDLDTFWHLAYGRAMVEQGRFINHEIFSYTAPGVYLGSHSQLAQVLLYLLWAWGGASALLGFKLCVAAVTFWLVFRTARLFAVGTVAAAVVALVTLAAGVSRFVERPELFSILLQAALILILFGYMRGRFGARILWTLPALLVFWDYLHGALYGLVVLIAFVGAEVLKHYAFPRLGWLQRWGGNAEERGRVKALLLWSTVTLTAMCLHPNGLFTYSSFLRVSSQAADYAMYGEFARTALIAQFFWFWFAFFAALPLILLCLRRIDFSAIAILIPFVYLGLQYNRATLALCLAAVPAFSIALVQIRKILLPRVGFLRVLPSLSAMLLMAAVLLYRQEYGISNFQFGTGINQDVFPVGSARFVKEVGLNGNMYNMDGYGGYLAFFLGPERKIFHYNQPGVFTALTDFVHKPQSRSQWNMQYAIIGKPEEYGMFQNEGFLPVYWEPTGMVLVRPSGENGDLLQRYRIRYFQPLYTDFQLERINASPGASAQLREEMVTYLSFRQDERIATLLAKFLDPQYSGETPERSRTLVAAALRYNGDNTALRDLASRLNGEAQ